jgi:hypothetical protein
MEIEINKNTIEKYPAAVSIDWNVFKKGCY